MAFEKVELFQQFEGSPLCGLQRLVGLVSLAPEVTAPEASKGIPAMRRNAAPTAPNFCSAFLLLDSALTVCDSNALTLPSVPPRRA